MNGTRKYSNDCGNPDPKRGGHMYSFFCDS